METETIRKYDELFSAIRSVGGKIIPRNKRHKVSLFDLKENSLIKIGKDLFLVESKGTYDEIGENFTWPEYGLRNLTTNEIVYLEVEEDDEIECCISIRKVEREEITSQNDLDLEIDYVMDMDYIKLDGTKYKYDDDYDVEFSKDPEGKKIEEATIVDFKKKGVYLTIEFWKSPQGESSEIWLSKDISPKSIEVIRN